MGMAVGVPRMPNESDDEYAIRSNVSKQMIHQLTTLVNELDELLVGVAIDQKSSSVYLDFEMTAKPGTPTAQQFAQAAQTKTNFAGFDLSGAAVTANWAGTLADADVAYYKSMIVTIRDKALADLKDQVDEKKLSDAEYKLATQVLGDLLDVVTKTVENKKSDGGMVLLLGPGQATLAAGTLVADGAKLEKILKQLVSEVTKSDPNLAGLVKLDAETHQGIKLHTAAIPAPDEGAKKVFGDTLEVVVGTSDQNLWVAAGRDAVKTLKQVIDKSKAEAGKAIPPGRLVVAATPIAKFAASMLPDGPPKQMVDGIVGALGQSAGKDRLTITSKAIPNGASVRIELEEGVLKVIPMIGQTMAAPGGPPMPPPAAAAGKE